MKSKLILAWALLAFACAGKAPSSAGPSPGQAGVSDGGDGQRLISLIDYVGADYGGAVVKGEVVSDFEYQEQLAFLESALQLAAHATKEPGDQQILKDRIADLQKAVLARDDVSVVSERARVAREEIVSRLGLRIMPAKRPDLRRAEALFKESCVLCHGADGLAQTETAATLDPRPVSFKDPERREMLSPFRVYNALTLGIEGTGMASFEALTPEERWDLAFYVMRLGHEGAPARGPVSITLADLSARTDVDLRASLQAQGHPSPQEGLVFARREAAFAEAPLGLGIDQTRAMVRQAAALAEAGKLADADRVALDAYLQGFEPLEVQISARDPNRTLAVEIAFRDFRAALSQGKAAEIQRNASVLDELVSRAQSQSGATLPIAAAFLIYFREGIEAALLVGALLGGVRKLGRADAVRAIHIGWVAAIVAGALSWVIIAKLVAIAPSQRELAEAVIGLMAAIVLFSVSFWMISKAESRKWMAFLKDQMNRGLSSGRVWSFAGVAFLAVYRECAETILFTEALMIEATGQGLAVIGGAVAGIVCVVAIALLVQNAFKRLPMPVFFGVSGVLLSLLAIVFAGSSVSAFVAAGYLKPNPISFPSFPMLGIHPDLSSLLVQLSLLLIVAGAGTKAFLDSRVPDRA